MGLYKLMSDVTVCPSFNYSLRAPNSDYFPPWSDGESVDVLRK